MLSNLSKKIFSAVVERARTSTRSPTAAVRGILELDNNFLNIKYAYTRFRGDCSFDLFKSVYDAGVVWPGDV